MPDIENLLRSSLEDVGESYEPTDTAAARERFLARKRKRTFRLVGSGVAVTAAAVAVALFVFSVPATEDDAEPTLPPAAAPRPEPIATIPVGEDPVSIAAGEDAVWVANVDRLSRIDPSTGELVATESLEAPGDEVVAGEGSVWVSDTDGFVSRFEPSSDGMLFVDRYRLVDGGDNHLDIAIAPGRFVAVDPAAGVLHSLDLAELDDPSIPGIYTTSEDESDDIAPTDVATGVDEVWLLDGEAGLVRQEGSGKLYSVPAGGNADLMVTENRVWIASGTGGYVVGIDPINGGRVRREVGGSYTDLASGGGYVWALTGESGEPNALHQIDPQTGELVGEVLRFDGVATDVTFAEGSVWVTDSESGTVIQIVPARV